MLLNPIFLPMFIETKVLDTPDDKHKGFDHVLNMHNINHRICTGLSINKIQDTINAYVEEDKEASSALGKQFTVIPYKVKKEAKNNGEEWEENWNNSHCKLSVSHGCFKKEDDTQNMCEFDSIGCSVYGSVAIPLDEDEMKTFIIKLDKVKDLHYDIKKPINSLKQFAKIMLPDDKATKFEQDHYTSFFHAYYTLRRVYQTSCNIRFGICDGCHRVNAIFNTIYEITIKNDALDKSVRNNLHDLQGKLSNNVIWEVWNYSKMGKFRLIN